ncbi:MAG: GDP-mannose 4,6-dehydratase, partial [Candidatus Omnitrophica bacterium]|nr:GDP-mannose 4,6-dehydratase [Candidatus Omnitrophota bacterium]
RIDHIYVDPHTKNAKFFLHYGDLSDSEQISNMIYNIKPNEIYHLAAQSHVRVSFDIPEYTGNVTALGTTRMLEAIKRSAGKIKFYQASSSEMFGVSLPPQNENSPFMPRSPYACAKVHAYWMAKNYREGYNIFACNGILFNHESPRRGETFVSRKITRATAAILAKKQDFLYLGNLEAKRDWGFAPEYCEAMHAMLQNDKPEDFVLGTGKSYSVKEFVEESFSYVGLNWKKYVEIDKRYFRPTEVDSLIADTKKAKKKLRWQPKIAFKELVKIMVDADMRAIGLKPIGEGDRILKENFPNRWWNRD